MPANAKVYDSLNGHLIDLGLTTLAIIIGIIISTLTAPDGAPTGASKMGDRTAQLTSKIVHH
jgi:hypothetical protein